MNGSEPPGRSQTRSDTLDRISDGVVALDGDLRYQYVNDRAEMLLETGADALLGTHIREAFPGTEGTKARERIERAIETDETVSFEQYNPETDSWFEVRVYPDNGGVTVFFTDITGRKQREREREAVNRQLNAVVENTNEAVYIKNPDGTYELLNDAAAGLFGLDPESAIGRRDEDLFDADSAAEIRETDERIMETGEGVRGETVRYIDGEKHVFFHDKSAYRNENGEIAGVMGISRDITEYTEHRRELRRAETLFRNTQDALFLIDVSGEAFRLERVNPAYERLTGLSNDELQGKTPREAFGDADGAAIEERYLECIERRESIEYEEELSVPEPESYWETRIAPVVVDGTVVQLVGATRNVTDRRRREKQLEDQRDDLELLTQMMSHDIRNDLQIVSAYAELLEDHVDEAGREHVQLIQDSATAAVELTKAASDLSEAMLGTNHEGQSVPLRATLEGQIGEIRASYENAAITVDGEIPTVSVLADELLGSVFRNVLKNAVQHNDKPVPEVTVRVEAGTDCVSVRVADNGPGIPENRLETIFGRGRKGLDSEGTGIGLYLVRTLVGQYGGSVGVENREPEGAVFAIELPRADTDRSHHPD